MVIFYRYVKLPEGKHPEATFTIHYVPWPSGTQIHWFRWFITPSIRTSSNFAGAQCCPSHSIWFQHAISIDLYHCTYNPLYIHWQWFYISTLNYIWMIIHIYIYIWYQYHVIISQLHIAGLPLSQDLRAVKGVCSVWMLSGLCTKQVEDFAFCHLDRT